MPSEGRRRGTPGAHAVAASRSRSFAVSSEVTSWLTEPGQPSIRLRTLTELLGRPSRDREVTQCRNEILEVGWAAEILARRSPVGGWADGSSQYRPKYTSTNWMMLTLSDLGVNREAPVIRDACERWMDGFATRQGGLGGSSTGTPHYCVAANQARALMRFGFAEDARVRTTLEWLVSTADPHGGWSCFGRGRNLDSWEAMSAFAAYPRAKWSTEMRACVEKAAEFYLERELHRQGATYRPWYRTHYPVHYYYDLLVGLEFMTELGYGADPRLDHALDWLRSRRRTDGRWDLDAVHPDVEGPIAKWFKAHPKERPTPFSLEAAGRPSKMITFRALKVLRAVDRARGARPEPT